MDLFNLNLFYRYALVSGEQLSTDWSRLSDESQTNPLLCLSMKCHGLKLHDRLQCLYTYCFTDMHMQENDQSSTRTKRQQDREIKPELTRSKKWQYSDPLQVCISTYCNGRRSSSFYQCVYSRCIAKRERDERNKR